MCADLALVGYNFASEGCSDLPWNSKTVLNMSVIIMILCVFGWLGQAFRDGADIN